MQANNNTNSKIQLTKRTNNRNSNNTLKFIGNIFLLCVGTFIGVWMCEYFPWVRSVAKLICSVFS